MKKILTLLITIAIGLMGQSHMAQAQDDNWPHRVYCELLGYSNLFSTKVKIIVDFGQSRSFTSDERLVDDNGKVIKFNSMVDGMNYMGQFGWKFVQAYVITIGNQNVYHWLLYKDIYNDDELFEGFRTKHQFKEALDNDPTLITCSIQYFRKKKKDVEWELVNEEYHEYILKDELNAMIADWRAKTNDTTDYDVKVKKEH